MQDLEPLHVKLVGEDIDPSEIAAGPRYTRRDPVLTMSAPCRRWNGLRRALCRLNARFGQATSN